MCRLVALSGAGPLSDVGAFLFGSEMLLSSRKGNVDGAGVAVNRPGQLTWLKTGGSAQGLVFGKDWKHWFGNLLDNHIEYDSIIGHTRLASAEWKGTTKMDGAYPIENTHPFVFGDLLGAHNGNFRDWESTIANLIGGKKDNYIDSMYFFDFLSRTAVDTLTLDMVVDCLKQVGTASYSLLLRHISSEKILVIRGNQSLYYAESNYGFWINTERENLVELPDFTNHALLHWNKTPLEMGTPTFIPPYTAWWLANGALTKIASFEEVKEINEPVVVTQTSWNWQQGAAYGHATYGSYGAGASTRSELDAEEIVARYRALRKLRKINLQAVDEDFVLTATELWGVSSFGLAWMESEQLVYLTDLMAWAADTDDGKYAPSKEKDVLWAKFRRSLVEMDPIVPSAEIYRIASYMLSEEGGFDVPYWHNDISKLQSLQEQTNPA